MLHTVFITVHALAATIAFAAGVLAAPAGRFLGLYRSGLVVMTGGLVGALTVGWHTFDPIARIAFAGLFVLAVVMIVRAELAARIAPDRTGGPVPAYLEHVGFTLISLADGFAIVAAIRAGAPGWLTASVAVGVVAAGHCGIEAAKRRLVVPRALAPAAATGSA
jgi:hypothetical protein